MWKLRVQIQQLEGCGRLVRATCRACSRVPVRAAESQKCTKRRFTLLNNCKREAISKDANAAGTSSTDVCPKMTLSPKSGNGNQKPRASNNVSNRASAKSVFQNLGIYIDSNRAKFPSYAVLVNRVQSFTSANSVFHKSPSEMAMAGFFYKGAWKLYSKDLKSLCHLLCMYSWN